MEVLFAIVLIFMLGYSAGVFVARRRHLSQRASGPAHRCSSCNYCFEISDTTKSLMHSAYADKLGCHMCRGSMVPVGYAGATISVIDADSFCDRWKERVEDG